MSDFKLGDKVIYKSSPNAYGQKGVVKKRKDSKFVYAVFHCGGDWENFLNYAAQSTPISKISLGWVLLLFVFISVGCKQKRIPIPMVGITTDCIITKEIHPSEKTWITHTAKKGNNCLQQYDVLYINSDSTLINNTHTYWIKEICRRKSFCNIDSSYWKYQGGSYYDITAPIRSK